MDDLACTGTETHLAHCPHNGIGQHNCRHNEDVSIACGATIGILTYRIMTAAAKWDNN